MWMSGSASPNELGSYGDKGVASPSNVPGCRCAATGWRDNDGNLWMFGCNSNYQETGTKSE
jgi:hypothetical protein